jgi:hypothetical protein
VQVLASGCVPWFLTDGLKGDQRGHLNRKLRF